MIASIAAVGRARVTPAAGFFAAGFGEVLPLKALFRSARFADVGSTARVVIRLLNDMTSQSAALIVAAPGRDRWQVLIGQRSRRSPAILPNTERLCENISISVTACAVYLNRGEAYPHLSDFPSTEPAMMRESAI